MKCPRCRVLCTTSELTHNIISFEKVRRKEFLVKDSTTGLTYEPTFIRKEVKKGVCDACIVELGGGNVYT